MLREWLVAMSAWCKSGQSLHVLGLFYCFTLIRGVALCGGALPLLHGLWSPATENPCSGLAQAGRGTLLLSNGSLLMPTAHQPCPVVMGTAVPAGCF